MVTAPTNKAVGILGWSEVQALFIGAQAVLDARRTASPKFTFTPKMKSALDYLESAMLELQGVEDGNRNPR